jgi:cytosine/adenosine deaminase-related metal-dependent hydrolase
VRGHHSADALLAAVTRGGYDCLGWPDGGRIAPGALADFITVATDTVRTAGTPPQTLVFSAGAADVRDVVVGGRRIVRGGVHLAIDVARELSEAIPR